MTVSLPRAFIVYCESRMLLDRSNYTSWRDIQEAYGDYKASLGPWTEQEVVSYLEVDCGADDARWPFTRQGIADFYHGDSNVILNEVR